MAPGEARQSIGDSASEDEGTGNVFQRFELHKLATKEKETTAVGSKMRTKSGRLAAALQKPKPKKRSSAELQADAEDEGSSEDDLLAQRRPRRRIAAEPTKRRSGRERTKIDYKDQIFTEDAPTQAKTRQDAVLDSDSDINNKDANMINDSDVEEQDDDNITPSSSSRSLRSVRSGGGGNGGSGSAPEAPHTCARGAPKDDDFVPSGAEVISDDDEDDYDDGSAQAAKVAAEGQALKGAELEKIMAVREEGGQPEYLCKFKGVSYRRLEWRSHDHLYAFRPHLVQAYQRKVQNGTDPVTMAGYPDGVKPEWRSAERVFAGRVRSGRQQYYVKWSMLGYAESTWEDAASLTSNEMHMQDQELLRRFALNERMPENTAPVGPADLITLLQNEQGLPEFKNGRVLRDYQVTSFKWMVQHLLKGQDAILGDEMGLGKTAQAISVLEFRRLKANVRGPFLVVAPLTTLGHWRREIETWTDMNAVCFMGGKDDRQLIVDHELWFRKGADPATGRLGAKTRAPKFNVLLTSFELLRDCESTFRHFVWDIVIVDEAHRLKSRTSATRRAVDWLQRKWTLLLTGTPIQNNMSELFSMMNLVKPSTFQSQTDFLARFGNPPAVPSTPAQLEALQAELRPVLLRRMKEDVETLPDKEEVIIWVELTNYQRSYYKAIFENQIGSLLQGTKSSALPNLRNLAMELRKLCCHPFLCNGLEDDLMMRLTTLNRGVPPSEKEAFECASGKITLLAKLLPKLRAEGRKVLIFSQFKIMLDLVQFYLDVLAVPWERIDGDVNGQERQAAMDRFQAGGDNTFAFMLSTRAGGQGITLTAADTIILYDSDWNPQNDVQAMARCHRIGQDKEVTIYRLVTRATYEETLINTANQKSGLNEAILGNINAGTNPEDNAARIAQLLRNGANLIADEAAAAEKAAHFQEQGIDDILQSRTSKRNVANKAGSTFSVASFRADGAAATNTADDSSFWRDLLPDAVKAHQEAEANKNLVHGPRSRRRVNYKEPTRHEHDHDHDSGDSDYDGNASDNSELGQELAAERQKSAQAGAAIGTDASKTLTSASTCLREAPAVPAGADADAHRRLEKAVALCGSADNGGRKGPAQQSRLLVALSDIDTMLLQWGPAHVAAAVAALEARQAGTATSAPAAHLALAMKRCEELCAFLAVPLQAVRVLTLEWQRLVQRASKCTLPRNKPKLGAQLEAAMTKASKLLVSHAHPNGQLASEADLAAARRVQGEYNVQKATVAQAFNEKLDKAVQVVFGEETSPDIRACWALQGSVEELRGHLFVRAWCRATHRCTQYAARDALLATYAAHTSGEALLRSAAEAGYPLPRPDEGSMLQWLQAQGVWRPSARTDGAVLDIGMQHGVNCATPGRAEGALMVAAVFDIAVGEPGAAFAEVALQGESPPPIVQHAQNTAAWMYFKRPDSGKLVVAQTMFNSLAMALAKRFSELVPFVALYATKSGIQSTAGPQPAGAAAQAHGAAPSSQFTSAAVKAQQPVHKQAGPSSSAGCGSKTAEPAKKKGSQASSSIMQTMLKASQKQSAAPLQQHNAPAKATHTKGSHAAPAAAKLHSSGIAAALVSPADKREQIAAALGSENTAPTGAVDLCAAASPAAGTDEPLLTELGPFASVRPLDASPQGLLSPSSLSGTSVSRGSTVGDTPQGGTAASASQSDVDDVSMHCADAECDALMAM